MFSHLSASDNEMHDDFTLQQGEVFEQCCITIKQSIGYDFMKHLLNSAGIQRFKHLQYDMVRLGLGLYGIASMPDEQKYLQTVAKLKTHVLQIKHISAGESIGYNRNAIVEKDTAIATIAIGYADGFARKLSKGVGSVFINGTSCPIVGNVCMDMCMVDVTGVNVSAGDEAIVFENATQINEIAAATDTITYEVLTNISQRVKRVYYYE